MEILDKEDPIIDTKGENIAFVGLLGFLITGIATLIDLWGLWITFSAFSSKAAPDAMQLSKGIGISAYAQWVMIAALIIGVICQNASSSYYRFQQPLYRKFIIIVSILALLGSFIPLNLILLIIALVSMISVPKNKK